MRHWNKCTGKNVTLLNTTFNDNNKGRVILNTQNVENLIVSKCNFTGYTKSFGYYRTDGLVRIDNGCKNQTFTNCNFFDTGIGYGNDLEGLNRCITFNHVDIEKSTVENCTFKNYNQGIVGIGKVLDVNNCTFDGTEDNSIYTNGEILNVDNCYFSNQLDEPIVTGDRFSYLNKNTFNGFRNKAVALTGTNSISSIVNNNTFINAFTGGQALSFREGAVYDKISFDNNIVKVSEIKYTNTSPIITTTTCKMFNVNDNYIETNQPSNSHVIRCKADFVNFSNNTIKQVANSNSILSIMNDVPDVKMISNGNKISGCRTPISTGVSGYNIETNAQYIGENNYSTLFCPSKPIYILPKGTVVYNTNYSGLNSVSSWISDGISWIENIVYKPQVHTTSNTPVNWSAPRFLGDLWIGVNRSVWIGIIIGDQTVNAWKKIID